MPHRKRIDDNQTEIVKALRSAGATVRIVSSVSNFVDIVVGFRGQNYLMEVKDGNKPPSGQKLTPGEEKFQGEWKGNVSNINSIDSALASIGVDSAQISRKP